MIINTHGMGQAGDILFQDIGDLVIPVPNKKRARARIQISVVGFHGLVEHDLLSSFMDLMGKGSGFREFGEDGEGDIYREIQEWSGKMAAVSYIINYQGDSGLKSEGF